MSFRRIATIFGKDLRDAMRDARVLVALLVPLGIGVFYNLTFDDDSTRPKATVVFAAADETRLPEAIAAVVAGAIDVTFEQVAEADDVRQIVANDDADLGFVTPAGFDAAIARGARPELMVFRPPSLSFGGDYVAAALDPALRLLAGAHAPAAIVVEETSEAPGRLSVIDEVGIRVWAVFSAIVMMIAMIAMLAVPVVLAEETEKKTLDALVLIASYGEVVAAKALLGVFYVAVMVPLLLSITRLRPEDGALFTAAVALLGVTLIGFGLLLAGLFQSANQLNTWSGIILVPVIAPAFIVGLPLPGMLDTVVGLLPTGGATKLILDSASQETLFADRFRSFLVVIAWGVAAYGLLLWQLSRRQA